MCTKRISLIRELNSNLINQVNDWLHKNCKTVSCVQIEGSDFEYMFKQNGIPIRLSDENLRNLFEFYKSQFEKYGIGCLLNPSEIYIGTSHLSTEDLEMLQKI